MVHLVIINWFDWSGICMCNIFRVRFKWKQLMVNLNITITNDMIIKSPHDSWNHKTGFGRRRPLFEVSCWRLSVLLSWWISWFVTMKSIELIHLSSNTLWEYFSSTDNAGIRLVYSYYALFSNNLLSNLEIFNNWLDSCCIIVGERLRTKMMKELPWSGQCSWGSNNF